MTGRVSDERDCMGLCRNKSLTLSYTGSNHDEMGARNARLGFLQSF